MERESEPGSVEQLSAAEAAVEEANTLTDVGLPAEAVTLTLPANRRYVRLARLVGAGLANELGLGVDRLDDVRLAIGEAAGLVTHAGADAIVLTYLLDEAGLAVSLEAAVRQDRDDLDPQHLALVEQVLAVACSSHSIDRRDRRISIRLTFTDGS